MRVQFPLETTKLYIVVLCSVRLILTREALAISIMILSKHCYLNIWSIRYIWSRAIACQNCNRTERISSLMSSTLVSLGITRLLIQDRFCVPMLTTYSNQKSIRKCQYQVINGAYFILLSFCLFCVSDTLACIADGIFQYFLILYMIQLFDSFSLIYSTMFAIKWLTKNRIDGLHLTSWRPCWKHSTKEYVSSSIIVSDAADLGGWHCLPHPERLIANQEYELWYGSLGITITSYWN